MRVVTRIIVGISVGVFVSALIVATYVVPILATEIDPNLGMSQCPGVRTGTYRGVHATMD
jgi:hypothetical protein